DPMCPSIEDPESRAKRLDISFREEYRGQAADQFLMALPKYEKMYSSDQHYGRTIVILQSSGTGKSRLVKELGEAIPTLSVCFRKGEDPSYGWPPCDTPAYRFFSTDRGSESIFGEELAAAFLGALMDVMNTCLDKTHDIPVSRRMSAWDIEDPAHIKDSSRYRCFEEVVKQATELLREKREHLDKLSNKKFENLRSVLTWHQDLFKILVLPAMTALAKSLHALNYKRFILAFDECGELNMGDLRRSSQLPIKRSSLVALQRIIKASDIHQPSDVTFWSLLLDTKLSVFKFAATGAIASSFRLRDGFKPLPVWMYLGFDQMVEGKEPRTAREANSFLWLAQFGRPLWSFCDARYDLLRSARLKLFASGEFSPWIESHVFAAYANRVLLEVADSEASRFLATDAVSTHMRMLMGVIDHTFVVTKAPSEPILAIAAAIALNEKPKSEPPQYIKAMDTLLASLIIPGIVLDRGVQGELCTRLLLTVARDEAVRTTSKAFAGLDAINPIKLSTFLKTLLGYDLGLCQEDDEQNTMGEDLQCWADEVWINFTHFAEVDGEINTMSEDFLCMLWSRTCAIQCRLQQPVIDGFFVGYKGDLDKPLDKSSFVVISYKTKARSTSATLAEINGLVSPAIGDSNERRVPEHVVLFMDLGTTTSFTKGLRVSDAVKIWSHLSYAKAGKATRWQGYAVEGDKEDARYCLNVRGHRATSYPVIAQSEQLFQWLFQRLFQRVLLCDQDDFPEYAENLQGATMITCNPQAAVTTELQKTL
ncbi:hypothetical protein EW026_g7126, partial [Hermanssonia centrifuga]